MKREALQKHRVRFITNTIYWALIVAIVFFVFKYFLNLVMPFFIATIIAALARPIALRLSRETKTVEDKYGRKITVPRKLCLNYNLAAVLSVLLLMLVAIGVLSLIAVPVINVIIRWMTEIPNIYNDTIMPALESLLHRAGNLTGEMNEPLKGMLEGAIPNLISSLGSFVTNISAKVLSGISSLATSLPSRLLQVLITLIATVFIAIDFDRIRLFVKANLRTGVLRVVSEVKNSLVDIVWKFLKSYCMIFLITSAELVLGLLLIGFKKAALVGFLVAVFDAFPVVGSGMILLPWSIITMTTNLWKGLALFALYLVVVIVRQIIEPKIVGKRVGLRPVVTLFCIFTGAKLFGALGLFGLPIAAAIISDLNESGGIHLYNKAVMDDAAEEPQ